MRRSLWVLLIIGIIVVLGSMVFLIVRRTDLRSIDSFAACVKKYPVEESYPRKCITPDGRSFTEGVPANITPIVTAAKVPTPKPSTAPTVTTSENIVVSSPVKDQTVTFPLTVKGKARVFENQFSYRLRDENGQVLIQESHLYNAPDAGLFGNFSFTINAQPSGTAGSLEVYSLSPKDGTEINKVVIPLKFKK